MKNSDNVRTIKNCKIHDIWEHNLINENNVGTKNFVKHPVDVWHLYFLSLPAIINVLLGAARIIIV